MHFIKNLILKTFDVREGEYRQVLLMQLNIFLIILTLLIIKPVVNARFISIVGIDRLPLVFVLVAFCAMVVSTLYSKALNGRSLGKVTIATLSISVLMLVAFGVLLHLQIALKPVLYALYIGVAIFGVLTTSQFWIMANLAFDARQAKRLFSLIGAGAIAGGITGGYLTSLLSNFVSGTNLLFVAAFTLSLCLPITIRVWKRHVVDLGAFKQKKRLKDFGEHPLRLISRSRHLTYLAIIVALGVLVAKLVEFQFSSIALASMTDPDELTGFFGFWLSTFNVVSLIIQLFFTRRIVGMFGVGTSLFALPGGVIFGAVMMLFTPVLWVAVATKLWEVSIKQSVNKAATELLALPIPLSVKSQTKSFIDVFVDLAATGVAGLCLIFIINGLELSTGAVSILIIAFVLIWFLVAIKVRKEYFQSFKAKLTQADKKALRPLPDLTDASVINGLKRALEQGSENQILYVLDKVREVPDKRLFDDIANLLDHPLARVREKALHCIYYLDQNVDQQRIELLLTDPEQEVRYKAFSVLISQLGPDRIQVINSYLTNQDPLISGAALVGLAEEARNNPEMQKLLKLEQRVHDKLSYMELCETEHEKVIFKTMVLRATGHADLKSCYPIIENALKDENPQLVLEAIRSAGYTMNAHFIDRILPFLVTKDTRKVAQDALLNFGIGIVNELKIRAAEPTINVEMARHIPAVLERIDHPSSITALLEMLNIPDVSLRLETLRSLNIIQRDYPHLKIGKQDVVQYIIEEASMFKRILAALYLQQNNESVDNNEDVKSARHDLIKLLERRLDGTLERIFRLLGLRYPADDVIPVYEGLRNIDPEVRMNSVEFLENMLDPNLKKTLMPIAETALLDTVSNEAITNLKVKIPDERTCFELLLEGRDPKLKLTVFRLIASMKGVEYIDLIQPLLESPQTKVHKAAHALLAELQG